jgi:hypothetical protein
MHFRIYSRHFIILDTAEAAMDLFEKRSRLYSGRPSSEMTRMVGRDVSVIFSQPGNRLNQYRKLLRAWINPEQTKLHAPIQFEELAKYLTILSDHCHGKESLHHLSRR